MAKIDDLQVSTIKIISGAITDWFLPVSGLITVTNGSGNPTFIWVTGSLLGDDVVRRGSNSEIIGSVAAGDMMVIVDESPEEIDSYYVDNGYATVVAAKVRKA